MKLWVLALVLVCVQQNPSSAFVVKAGLEDSTSPYTTTEPTTTTPTPTYPSERPKSSTDPWYPTTPDPVTTSRTTYPWYTTSYPWWDTTPPTTYPWWTTGYTSPTTTYPWWTTTYPWYTSTHEQSPTTSYPWWDTTTQRPETTTYPWWTTTYPWWDTTTTRPTTTTARTTTTTAYPWTTTSSPGPQDCPLGWLNTPQGCYLFDFSSCILGCSWFEAYQVCEQHGGHLVEIHNHDQWKLLSSELYLLSQLTHTEDLKWWTGAHYTENEGFTWFFSGQHLYFTDWAPYEPSSFDDSAVYLAKSTNQDAHRWHSTKADERNGHPICQK